MKITAATAKSATKIDAHAIGVGNKAHQRRLEISFAAPQAGANRPMI
jgi:hypothetical protein